VRCTIVSRLVDGLSQPASARSGGRAQRPSGVADHRHNVAHRLLGDIGQLPGDPPHHGLGLIALLGTT